MFKSEELTINRVIVADHNSLDILTKLEFVKELIAKYKRKL